MEKYLAYEVLVYSYTNKPLKFVDSPIIRFIFLLTIKQDVVGPY